MVIHIKNIKIPEHIAIIPDGNRRFAKKLLEAPEKAHDWGMKKAESVTGWCRELGIKNTTFYTLSLENLERRPQIELEFLFGLFRKEMDDIIEKPDHWINKTNTKVNFIGELDMLPKDLQEKMNKVREKTRGNKEWSVNLAIAYGGRQDILGAVKKISKDVSAGNISSDNIDEAAIRHNLSTSDSPDPDLIIRTGGERRLSNFLTFQSTYSELIFLDTLWPDFGKDEFVKAVKEFGDRERRFGK
jgi:tritrans,polycis-undecaprenyl-diphosphate synthase [geranylgeranyl-diphosphate specific]